MASIDYAAMSYQELRRYFLAHRQDTEAFQAYLAKRRERSLPVITTIHDPDFEQKIRTAAERQVREHQAQKAD
ncbi:MAG: hypothetical protein AB4042_07340 [Leptolyngbyaceae cyanobacterium]